MASWKTSSSLAAFSSKMAPTGAKSKERVREREKEKERISYFFVTCWVRTENRFFPPSKKAAEYRQRDSAVLI